MEIRLRVENFRGAEALDIFDKIQADFQGKKNRPENSVIE